jgi:hypothetical protein
MRWILVAFLIVGFFSVSCAKKTMPGSTDVSGIASKEEILYYTCGMHPSVKVSPAEYNNGSTNCPICNMGLVPVYKEGTTLEEKQDEPYYGCGVKEEGHCPHCDSGKPDSECICGQHSFMIKGRKVANCPICGKPIKKIEHYEDKLNHPAQMTSEYAVSRVKVKGEEIALAGVETRPATKMHLYKKIRTVGRVAYDPQLAIAQEEYIASVRALDRIKEGNIAEIKERAESLVESAGRKLKLLGLGDEQVKELGEKKEVQAGLILPESKMWIYGEAYEYELSWVKAGQAVRVTTASFSGEEFEGVISSVNPVLDPKTRSVTFRAEIHNPDLKLKPEMYVDVMIRSMYVSPDGEHMILAVPKNAVLDTGVRKIIWVDKGSGEYEGREVNIGPVAADMQEGTEAEFYPVLKGLAEGEFVVTKANFLIDSQSQITGVAAAAYGGALGADEEKNASPVHQH